MIEKEGCATMNEMNEEQLAISLGRISVGSKIKVRGRFYKEFNIPRHENVILTAIPTENGEDVHFISEDGLVFTPKDVAGRVDEPIAFSW